MNWNKIESIEELNQVIEQSNQTPILIFKHSTRCSISSMALNRLERAWSDKDSEKVTPYYLDLISHRDVSNNIAETLGIMHESPQAIVLKDGKAIYNASHMSINHGDIISL